MGNAIHKLFIEDPDLPVDIAKKGPFYRPTLLTKPKEELTGWERVKLLFKLK